MAKTSNANIRADNNGVYLKSRITKKSYFYGNDQVITVYEVTNNHYYSKRGSHSKVYVPANNILLFHRTYRKAIRLSLTRTIVKMANPINGPMSPYLLVFYHAQQITKSTKLLWYKNAIQEIKLQKTSLGRPNKFLAKLWELERYTTK